jgi:hypothetical protein
MSGYRPCGRTKAKEAMAFWRVVLPNFIDRVGYGRRHGLASTQMLQGAQDLCLNRTSYCRRHLLTSDEYRTLRVAPPD